MSSTEQDANHAADELNGSIISAYTAVPTEDESLEKVELEQANWWDRVVLDTWIPEITALIASSTCLLTIIGLLILFRDKATPTLPHGITLNAMVSILATASRSLLVYVVAASIGQLKWSWYYEKKHNLHNIQIFDEASRGPLGSLKMLVTLRARPLATIGALITMLALGYDPSLQQVLSYPSHAPRLSRSTAFLFDVGEPRWLDAINAGLWSPPERFSQQPSCPTSNCIWKPYHSIGWCAKCEDAIAYAKLSNCPETFYEWPKDSMIKGTNACSIDLGQGSKVQVLSLGDEYTRSWTAPPSFHSKLNASSDRVWALDVVNHDRSFGLLNDTYLGVKNPILALGRARIDLCERKSTQSAFDVGLCIKTAEKCILSLCERKLNTSVINGIAHTEVLGVNFGDIQVSHDVKTIWGDGPEDYTFVKQKPCWSSASELPTEAAMLNSFEPYNHVFCPDALEGWSGALRGTYQGKLEQRLTGAGAYQWDPTVSMPESGLSDAVYNSSAVEHIALSNLSSVLQGVAASLSALALEGNTTVPVNGIATTSETYVYVTWAWLALPVSVLLGAVVLLSTAAVHSQRYQVKLWKASILPLLYHGLEPGLLARQYALDEVSAMAKVAEKSEVRLADTYRQDRVVLTSG